MGNFLSNVALTEPSHAKTTFSPYFSTPRCKSELQSMEFEGHGTPDVFPDYSGYAASASPSRACRIVFHPSAFLSFPLRYHSM